MKIAVTGGLGTGKSTVTSVLANSLATDHIDTDKLCRLQMEPGGEAYNRFAEKFGENYLLDDGSIDRTLLRNHVFNNETLRTELESILHPLVQQEVEECSLKLQDQGKDLVVEVPLLYEVGWQDHFDCCVLVYVPESICIERVIKRSGLAVVEIERIIAAQMPLNTKRGYADFVVDNSGTFASMAQQVAWLTRNMQSRKKYEN